MSLRAEIAGSIDLFEVHRQAPERYPFLLQSVAGHPQSGRYDILFGFPGRSLQARAVAGGDFFGELARAIREEALPAAPTGLPFCGGWFLLLGYEAARFVEPGLRLPPSPYGLPDALAVRCTAAAIHDRERGVTTLLAEQDPAQLEQLRQDVDKYFNNTMQDIDSELIVSVHEDSDERFLGGVRRILDYLQAGDIFQANLSRAWRAQLASGQDYQGVYRRLRQRNPAPFAGLACWGGSAVLSSSPERLVQIDGGWAQTRPIAGTRPRSASAEEDERLKQGLIGNLKERAEHVMLIDLERNDLGRVCEPGSVEVSELMTIESYAHVHHIVSNVRGRLRGGIGPAEVLRAVFPGGTITGCPKVRAMEIIAELEGVGRGAYTGAMGYLSNCGRLDTNILIRSLVCENGEVSFRTGAGIVADSKPEAELAETRAKARGLLLALGVEA
ncbi:aminodeoxychorismate synthase component I [Solimonas sp. K1W22B-7]|uniref:aminodeoxychorismate synthase component I n=1 Tax=Solimonas sp. K1W22B-7 TaxID=2303331 RepID=UPI000E333967|nr:aminodeoxychorismate synthase component I [Solimonas sp. K1W22B-7]AXQ29435.1 aminodeoxychorismate synthase component I [Solimonas sp. K1W22B-7]